MAQQPDAMPSVVSSNSSQHHEHSPTASTSSFTTKASETSSTTSPVSSIQHTGRRRALTGTSIASSISSPTLAPPPTYSTILDMSSVTMADSARATSPNPSVTSLSPSAHQLQYNNRMSRAPSFLGRPGQSPLGPRTRFGPRAMSSSSAPGTPLTSTPPPLPPIPPHFPPPASSISIASSNSSPHLTARDSLFPSPTHDPAPQYPGPATDSPAHTEITLPSIEEHDDPPPPHSPPRTAASALPPAPSIPAPKPPSTSQSPPVPSTAPPLDYTISRNGISASPVITPPSPAPSASPSLQHRPSKRAGTIKRKISAKPAVLPPAPKLSFESVTVDFKSLPLEAFLWTLNNEELQKLVSRAIRTSARESFVRLLSLDNLERAIPEEIERLEALKARTQAHYRFMTMKRTMLLQALNQSSATGEIKVGEDGITSGSNFAKQLSETCAECDKALETVVKTADQILQLQKMVDTHWASALAIALRKLNKSYAKRTQDLVTTRERVTNLEAELKEAWDQAAKYAEEMDDVERENNFISDEESEAGDDEVEIFEDEEIPAPAPPPPATTTTSTTPVADTDKAHDISDTDSELDEAELAVIEKAEVVALPPSRRASTISDVVLRRGTKSFTPQVPPPLPLNILPEFTPVSPMPRLSGIGKSPQSPAALNAAGSPVSPVASSSRPPSMPPRSPLPPIPPLKDPARYAKHNRRASDATSIRSTRSTKSTKSTARSLRSARQSQGSALLSPGSRPGSRLGSRPTSALADNGSINGTRLSQVSAARSRSQRASKGSLRIPRTPGSAYIDQPPVPDLPPEFMAAASALIAPSTSVLANSEALAMAGEGMPAQDDVLSPEAKISRIRRTSLDMGNWIGVQRAKTVGAQRAGQSVLGSTGEETKPSRTVDDINFRPVFVGEIQSKKPKKPSRPVPEAPEQLDPSDIPWLSPEDAAVLLQQSSLPVPAGRDSTLSFSRFFNGPRTSFETEEVLNLDLDMPLPDQSVTEEDQTEEGEEGEEEEELEEEEEYEEYPVSATEESNSKAILATGASPLSNFIEYSHAGHPQTSTNGIEEVERNADATADVVDKNLPPIPAHSRQPSTSSSSNFNPNVTDPRILSALSKIPLGRNTSFRGRPLMKKRYSLHLPIFKHRNSVVPKVVGANPKSDKSEDGAATSESETSSPSTSTSLGQKIGFTKSLGSVRSLPGRLAGGSSSSGS